MQRCRERFGDPLVERVRRTISRTTKAELLREPRKSILAAAVDLVDPPTPLSKPEQVVRITTADDPMAILIEPSFAKRLPASPSYSGCGLKWSGKTGQPAKMYPTITTGYTNDEETQFFGQV